MPEIDLLAELDAMASRHYRMAAPHTGGAGMCVSDRHRWPCHAHLALTALRAVLRLTEPAVEIAMDLDGNPEQPLLRVVRCDELRAAIAAALNGDTGA